MNCTAWTESGRKQPVALLRLKYNGKIKEIIKIFRQFEKCLNLIESERVVEDI